MSEMPPFNPNLGDEIAYDDLAKAKALDAENRAKREATHLAELEAQGGVPSAEVKQYIAAHQFTTPGETDTPATDAGKQSEAA